MKITIIQLNNKIYRYLKVKMNNFVSGDLALTKCIKKLRNCMCSSIENEC